MKLKKIILLSLAAVVLLGAIAGVWLYFSQPETSNNTWTYALKRSALTRFASTENGCYFLTNDTILHFYDYETKVTVPLCSKVACEHSDRTCDGYVDGVPGLPLCFINNHIYYVENWQNGSLIRRNATGGDVTTIGIPARKFVELQQAVAIEYYAPDGEYLYYSGSAENKENVETELEEIFFVGRIHLSSGKDEILFEETMDKTMEAVQLKAAKDGSCLFFCQKGMDIPSTDPNYSEELRNIPVGLYRWTEETGEITTVFEGLREQCENFYFVEGDWVYYNTMGNNKTLLRGDNYRINIETGETEFICGNASLSYLGGSYALYKTGFEDYRLIDLNTKAFLPVDDDTGVTSAILNTYDEHVFILTFSETIEDSMVTTTSTTCMIRHDSLKNGLQAKDLIPIYLFSTRTEPVTDPTDPSTPTNPIEHLRSDLFEKPEWSPFSIDFIPFPQPPEEQMEKNIQYLPETVENPDNLPVLKWVFALTEMDRTWTENAVIELNQMLADKKMPFRVQFAVLMSQNTGSPVAPGSGIGRVYGNYALLASEEAKELLKDADLIFGYMTPEEMQALLMPITEYVKGDAEYSLQNSVPHRLDWLTTTVDGEIYGISQKITTLTDRYFGWCVDKPLMQKAGLTASDFQKDFWEMDEVFEKLYKANGNQPIISAKSVDDGVSIQVLGSQPDPSLPDIILNPAATVHQLIGAIFAIDDSGDSPKVVNVLESIRYIQEAVLRYREAGYIGGETSYIGYYGVSTSSEPSELQPLVGNTMVVIPVTAPRFDSFYGKQNYLLQYTGINGIAATSQYKEEALMLLNLLAEDDAFRKQFLYGKEGRDYTMEDGIIVPIESADGSCYSMSSAFCGYKFFDNEELEDYRNFADSVPSVAYPIAFDYSEYTEELEKIALILNDVYPVFFNHKDMEIKSENKNQPELSKVIKEPKMDAELYDRMLEKLNDVGTGTIIAGLQQQLDEWLAKNPDWQ